MLLSQAYSDDSCIRRKSNCGAKDVELLMSSLKNGSSISRIDSFVLKLSSTNLSSSILEIAAVTN